MCNHTKTKHVPYFKVHAIDGFKQLYKDNNFQNIQQLHSFVRAISCRWRLLLASLLDSKSFEELSFVYTSIFPNVEKIKLEYGTNKIIETGKGFLLISLVLTDGTVVEQPKISSGMFKTLMLLSDLMLSSDNTVLLIDELENSLGVNCLPDIIQEIKSANFQCIVSTHHPKIINDIPVKHWKIVNRKGNEIHVDDATDLEKSSSHHDKFIQLINSSIYKNGNS